ncbi:HepT-like ribonuclease domain-containing protein [Lacisediminimonas profundi]|uniref:HepT-like ribonuclease domain-containing protein n=1 Tax=Lacisediminimonas profundi TaxID=2603856 RepID=UPI00124B73C6|nr:DUF86 domain-containing protein [Lacisediminimonas profundi]
MTRNEQRLEDYVDHILTAIQRIERYCLDLDESGFKSSELIQDAVIRNFEIIGEASNNIDRRFPEFLAKFPELPLIDAYEMRNALAHGYFKVDLKILWSTIEKDLPNLLKQLASIRDATWPKA